MRFDGNTDFYRDIGVDLNGRDPASVAESEIKTAYVKLARANHPDRLSGKSQEEIAAAQERMQKATHAKQVLLKPDRRQAYHDYLKQPAIGHGFGEGFSPRARPSAAGFGGGFGAQNDFSYAELQRKLNSWITAAKSKNFKDADALYASFIKDLPEFEVLPKGMKELFKLKLWLDYSVESMRTGVGDVGPSAYTTAKPKPKSPTPPPSPPPQPQASPRNPSPASPSPKSGGASVGAGVHGNEKSSAHAGPSAGKFNSSKLSTGTSELSAGKMGMITVGVVAAVAVGYAIYEYVLRDKKPEKKKPVFSQSIKSEQSASWVNRVQSSNVTHGPTL